MVTDGGEWNWSYLEDYLPTEVLMCIATKKVLVRGGAVDQIGWLLNTERQFIVKSAYEIVGPGVNVATDPIWANIHRFNGLLRIKDFLWLVFKGKIMTNVERVLRGFAVDVRCLRCLMEPEDHLLRCYALSIIVWSSVVKPACLQEFITMDLHAWVVMNLQNPSSLEVSCVEWDLLFGAIVP
ncbi:hypothetical protein V6N13_076665 [Hibiscus sabdariffa]